MSFARTLLFALALCLAVGISERSAFSQNHPPRFQARYTPVFSDDIETLAPSIGPAFVLDSAGSITSDSAQVVAGNHSVKGEHIGGGAYTPYLRSNSVVVPLLPNQAYQVSFKYRVLVAPDQGFEVLFFSPTAGGQGNFLPSFTVTGSSGSTGTATLTNTLGPFGDTSRCGTLLEPAPLLLTTSKSSA